jgi:hypothetical protein
MPASRRWRPRDLGQAWCPLAAGPAGPGRSQPGAITAITLMAFAGQLPAAGLEQRLTTALDTAVHLTAGHDLSPVRLEPHAA